MGVYRIRRLGGGDSSNPALTRKEGDRVKAKCEGWTKYFDGEITRVHSDGTYDIKFEDGERKRGVTESRIQDSPAEDTSANANATTTASRRKGDKVYAKCSGWARHYFGEITRVNSDGTYDMKFEDGERKRGVTESQIQDSRSKEAANVESLASSSVQQIVVRLAAMAKDFSGAGQFFELFDNDDSGIVSVDEFHKAIRSVWGDEFASQTELDAAFAQLDSHFDPSGDGNIDLDEFKEALVSEIGSLPSKEPFAEGDRIEAKCSSWIKFFPGTVQTLNADATYSVKFDDGERKDVQESEMRLLQNALDGLDTERAAVALQASMRRRGAKKRVKKRREEVHATRKIQAVTRGRRDRKRVKKLREK